MYNIQLMYFFQMRSISYNLLVHLLVNTLRNLGGAIFGLNFIETAVEAVILFLLNWLLQNLTVVL